MKSSSAHRRPAAVLAASTLLVTGIAGAAYGAAATPLSETLGLRNAVTVAGVREHQAAFQGIADANGGNRVAGSPGYAASAAYVEAKLRAAGYTVTRQPFEFTYNADRTAPVLQEISPIPRTFVAGPDFATMTGSGSGDVTAAVTAVDLMIPPSETPGASTSGCEAADFAGFPAGSIALMQRGTCNFSVKAANALASGASAAIIFNEGQPGRTGVINGTLGDQSTLPVVGATYDLGDMVRNGVTNGSTGVTARLKVDRVVEQRTTENLIAETPGGDPSKVVVVGAHLDSVPTGPGINDNGSGSAGILEIAEQIAARGIVPRNKIRFAWWGGEEFNLLGSTHYVDSLSEEELGHIALNLNFDMIGSPNFVRFVYDGDNSTGAGVTGPQGSGEIERVFHDYFRGMKLKSAETPFNGRSDYGPFIAAGIPAGGLFTGAEGIKTAQQVVDYGGTAGAPYDSCYHLACDTYANNNDTGLDQMVDAAAHTVLTFAKRNFAKSPLVNPAGPVSGTSAAGTSGGLHEEELTR